MKTSVPFALSFEWINRKTKPSYNVVILFDGWGSQDTLCELVYATKQTVVKKVRG